MRGKSVLSFFLGMIVGIIVFVVAIGGAVYGIIANVTVGGLQSKFTDQEIISSDSVIYDKTLLEAVMQVVDDVKDLQSLSLETLYQHYGISLLKEIGGIDLTQKEELYTTPLLTLVNNPDIIVNAITLGDIGTLTNLDFSTYGLPILEDNIDNGVITAVDNILKSVNDSMTIRSIKDNLGIDIGVEDNVMIQALQDVQLRSFGEVINGIYLNNLLQADVDYYLQQGENEVYVKCDLYQEVSVADLENYAYIIPWGVETYISGAVDTDDDGTKDVQQLNELRYIKKGDNYVVDNSCYLASFNASENEKTFYRHIVYKVYNPATDDNAETYYVPRFVDRVDAIFGSDYQLLQQGFQSLKDVYTKVGENYVSYNSLVSGSSINISSSACYDNGNFIESEKYTITEPKRDSKLHVAEAGDTTRMYVRGYNGAATPILKTVAYLTVAELQNANNLLDNLTLGDVIDMNDDTPKLLVSLKDCTIKNVGDRFSTLELGDIIEIGDDTSKLIVALQHSTLDTIGTDVDNLAIEDIFDVDDPDTSLIIKALAKHGCTLSNMAEMADELALGEVMEIDYDVFTAVEDLGRPVGVDETVYTTRTVQVPFNEFVHDESQRVGDMANVVIYTLYDEAEHGVDAPKYVLTHQGDALALQSLAKRGTKLTDMGSAMDDLALEELLRLDNDSALVMKSLAQTPVNDFATAVNTLTIDKVIEIDETSPRIMQSLKAHGCTLDNLADSMNTLTIDEIIEIDETSPVIMQSLAKRGCTLDTLADVAGELTFAEMVEIISNEYVENANGNYVLIVDTTAYVPYDANDPNMSLVTRYSCVDGDYVVDANGDFVHAFYFTVYNPALHDGMTTYSPIKNTEASSKLLQRFAHSVMQPEAFNSLVLADVMDMDLDHMTKTDKTFALAQPEYNYFVYNSEKTVFLRANLDTVANDTPLFFVTKTGETNALVKRIAYSTVENIAGTIDAVMGDMLLNEIITINMYFEVSVAEDQTHGGDIYADADHTKKYGYFIPYNPNETVIDGDTTYYTYVYDAKGKYMKRDYAYFPIDQSDLTPVGSASYTYVNLPDASSFGLALASNNVYYKTSDNEYVYNIPLCSYCALQGDYTNLYTRVAGSDFTADTYSNENLYVELGGEYVAYDPTNLTHHNFGTYYVRESGNAPYFVSTSARGDAGDDNYRYRGVNEFGQKYRAEDLTFSKKICDEVYFLDDDGNFVYINGKYVPYNPSLHGDAQRYDMQIGCVASIEQAFYNVEVGDVTQYRSVYESALTKVVIEKEQSVSILRLFARNEVKLDNLNSVLDSATISDIIDVDPNSILSRFSHEKLSTIETAFESALSTLTVGELIEWASITDVKPIIVEALRDVSVSNLFISLEYDQSKGIYINLAKALGYEH